MPPAAVGAAFTALGASAATAATVTAFVSAVYVGAAVGAAVGAGTALLTGGDILDGAVKGAVIGGIAKGVGFGFSQMASSGASAGGVGEAGLASDAAAAPGMTAQQVSQPAVSGLGAADSAGNVVASNVAPVTQQAAQSGFLDKAIGFIEKNPKTSEILAGGVAGAAKAIGEKRNRQAELEALMERDRLMIEANKVRGLENVNIGSAIPSVGGFLERPKWRLEDLKVS